MPASVHTEEPLPTPSASSTPSPFPVEQSTSPIVPPPQDAPGIRINPLPVMQRLRRMEEEQAPQRPAPLDAPAHSQAQPTENDEGSAGPATPPPFPSHSGGVVPTSVNWQPHEVPVLR
ncbi:MAG: hypothetical protein R3B90_23185 [Planctomycetaceae bacterium]